MPQLSSWERWWYNSLWHRLYLRLFVPRFLRACPEPFRGEVLEIGSGGGWSSRRILETCPQVELTASDVDPRAAKVFAKLKETYGQRLKFNQADLRRLPFDRDAFDMVVALNVLHHADDVPGALNQFIRVLRPGGLLGLSDASPKFIPRVRSLFTSRNALSNRTDLTALLKEEGCIVLREYGGTNYYIWARKPHPVNTIANTTTY